MHSVRGRSHKHPFSSKRADPFADAIAEYFSDREAGSSELREVADDDDEPEDTIRDERPSALDRNNP